MHAKDAVSGTLEHAKTLPSRWKFPSLDPLSIIDFAIETGKTLRKISKTPLSTFNEDMIGTGFDFDPSDLSQGSANTDAGDDFNTSFD